jgi:hypothetical protein
MLRKERKVDNINETVTVEIDALYVRLRGRRVISCKRSEVDNVDDTVNDSTVTIDVRTYSDEVQTEIVVAVPGIRHNDTLNNNR